MEGGDEYGYKRVDRGRRGGVRRSCYFECVGRPLKTTPSLVYPVYQSREPDYKGSRSFINSCIYLYERITDV